MKASEIVRRIRGTSNTSNMRVYASRHEVGEAQGKHGWLRVAMLNYPRAVRAVIFES